MEMNALIERIEPRKLALVQNKMDFQPWVLGEIWQYRAEMRNPATGFGVQGVDQHFKPGWWL